MVAFHLRFICTKVDKSGSKNRVVYRVLPPENDRFAILPIRVRKTLKKEVVNQYGREFQTTGNQRSEPHYPH